MKAKRADDAGHTSAGAADDDDDEMMMMMMMMNGGGGAGGALTASLSVCLPGVWRPAYLHDSMHAYLQPYLDASQKK